MRGSYNSQKSILFTARIMTAFWPRALNWSYKKLLFWMLKCIQLISLFLIQRQRWLLFSNLWFLSIRFLPKNWSFVEAQQKSLPGQLLARAVEISEGFVLYHFQPILPTTLSSIHHLDAHYILSFSKCWQNSLKQLLN